MGLLIFSMVPNGNRFQWKMGMRQQLRKIIEKTSFRFG